MILTRLAGSGSVPALEQVLKKADGSHSGVLNKEEFKRAMLRFGIELEPKQLESIMEITNLKNNPDAPVSTKVILENFDTLKHDFMEYPRFIDNLDNHNIELHKQQDNVGTESHASKVFTETGQAQLHPGKHQGRKVARKVSVSRNS